MLAQLPNCLIPTLARLLLLAVSTTAWAAADEAVTAEHPAEYMIYQYPDTALVLKVDVAEAEFSVRTFGPENALLRSSGVPGRRIGPVFQQIDANSLARQLMIEVTPGRPVPRSAIRLEVLQFAADDRNAANQLRAYQMVSVGTETAHASDASTWASKAYSLRNAAGVFAGLGMEEMRLWSEYLAAHLVLHQLADPLMALELVGAVQAGASRAGYAQTELAARTLEAEAVLQLAAESGARSAALYHVRAHEVLAHVVELARQLGLTDEHGRALYQDGRVYELQGEPERALEQYRAAVAVTEGGGDTGLLNEIRATAAALYETEGRAAGAIAMLDDIAGDLTAVEQGSAELELALRLFEKGRLLNNTYRYEEAVTELSQALALQQANAGPQLWGPTSLELAWAQYSAGAMEEALALLDAALPGIPVSGNEAALARAYGSLGNMQRQWREFGQAERARERQGTLLGNGRGRAAWLIEAALDTAARDGPGSGRAQDLAREARQAAVREGEGSDEQRAILLLCLQRVAAGSADACEERDVAAAYESLREAGIPWLAADAALLHARILSRSGRAGAARERMDGLIDELAWYRRALPGVLGAWYAQNRAGLTREYLALTRADGGSPADLLLAMERVHQLESVDHSRPDDQPLDAAEQEALRSVLWRREAASGEMAVRLSTEVNGRLASARAGPGATGKALSAADLDTLLADLGRSEALLTFYFAGSVSQALVARRGVVRAIDLPAAARLHEQLEELGDALSGPPTAALTGQLDALGKTLLQPVAGLLPERVYLLPTGPLRAVPLDALRLNGRYFAEDHDLVNLTGLGSIPRRAPALPAGFRDRVFVAGNPQEQGDPFNLDFRASPEIAAVTDQFVGPGLHIVQGVALRKDEFQDDRFAGAKLIHLALAGTLKLDMPDRSRLLLAPADAGRGESRSFLAPSDVRGFDLAAQLVVLSGTAVAGRSQSVLDRRLPFVADFLEAGSAAVLVSLWPGGERVNADFAVALYRGLLSEPDMGEVLAATKRAQIAANPRTNLPAWAGFQLFIR